MSTAEVCRKHGLSQGTLYNYESKYGGMEVSDVAKLRTLENENAKLERLLDDTMLDNVVLKDLLVKN
jgi:putative transposase